MEIEKARNCLDLNVSADADIGDHFVPTIDKQEVMSHSILEGNPINGIAGFGVVEKTDNFIL